MANKDQLILLRQGVATWNAWRETHRDETIDLIEVDLLRADLRGANLYGAQLRRAQLSGANLSEADLSEARLVSANLSQATITGAQLRGTQLRGAQLGGADLREADLREAKLLGANLRGADLRGAQLRGAQLRRAQLSGANLCEANLREANLIQTNLSGATVTGAQLYGTARDDWRIDGIRCEYVFWDIDGKERTPKDRNFQPGEFETLYKSLPTLTYYFEQGFTPIDAVVMDRVVQAINEQHPEFELKLTTLDSRGQPHAMFTVIRAEYIETAQQQVASNYESTIKVLEGQKDQLMQVIKMLGSGGITIHEAKGGVNIIQAGGNVAGDIVAGNKDQRAITTGRDYHEKIGDKARVTSGDKAQPA